MSNITLEDLKPAEGSTSKAKRVGRGRSSGHGKTFKASGGAIKLSKNSKSIDFVFEVIRREPEWEKKIAKK